MVETPRGVRNDATNISVFYENIGFSSSLSSVQYLKDISAGLKFLLQKVAQIPQAANLYKQTGAAWSIYMLTLFQLCLSTIREQGLTTPNIQEIIEQHSRWAFLLVFHSHTPIISLLQVEASQRLRI